MGFCNILHRGYLVFCVADCAFSGDYNNIRRNNMFRTLLRFILFIVITMPTFTYAEDCTPCEAKKIELAAIGTVGGAAGGSVGAGSAAATCSTPKDSNVGAASGYATNAGGRTWLATQFSAAGDAEICKIELYLLRIGTATMDLSACIYSNNDATTPDEPNALIGSCSSVVAASGIGTSEEVVPFNNVSASILSGGLYWVVFKSSSAGTDASNNITWNFRDGAAIEIVQGDSDGTGPWSLQSSTRSGKFALYSD